MDNAAPSRLHHRVMHDLGTRIRAGEFAPGVRLPAERLLAVTYGVSRPTVRQALLSLEKDGLLQIKSGSGVYVTGPERPAPDAVQDVDVGPFELLEARRAIESEICALAAVRIGDEDLAALEALLGRMGDVPAARAARSVDELSGEFHRVVARSTANSMMVMASDTLWKAWSGSPQTRLLRTNAPMGADWWVKGHGAVLAALRSKSPDAARKAMKEHLTDLLDSLLAAHEAQAIGEARARTEAERSRYGQLA